MRFYFPDSQDQVDPSFDFESEERLPFRIRQRDDLYAHEVLDPVPYKGMLVSKAMVDGVAGAAGRYSAQQRQRLYRVGVREFFRLADREDVTILGDCGAFTYVREHVPPYSVDEVIDFYEGAGFDEGVSPDHVILGFDPRLDHRPEDVPEDWSERQRITLEFAQDFWRRHADRHATFAPIGVAQGWSPGSYAESVRRLQHIGYSRIAVGGMIAQKTPEILAVLEAIDEIRDAGTQLHLFGVTRVESIPQFAELGVTSFDSTSPFRQAFKDDRDNYYDVGRNWLALRVPQVDANPKLQRRILAGEIDGRRARQLEEKALTALASFDVGAVTADEAVAAIDAYQAVCEPDKKSRAAEYREVLRAAPWKRCDCAVCRSVGIQVIIFRGTERNKRRGFHNLHVFARRFADMFANESLTAAAP